MLIFLLLLLEPIAVCTANYLLGDRRENWQTADGTGAALLPRPAEPFRCAHPCFRCPNSPLARDRSQWFGAIPETVVEVDGDKAEQLIPKLRSVVESYKFRAYGDLPSLAGAELQYIYPGNPDAVPELNAVLPPTAVGKDYPYAVKPSEIAFSLTKPRFSSSSWTMFSVSKSDFMAAFALQIEATSPIRKVRPTRNKYQAAAGIRSADRVAPYIDPKDPTKEV